MSEPKTIVKNTTVLLASELVNKALSFALAIAIARLLDVQGFGQYSFVFAFLGLFAIIQDFGLSTYVVRQLSRFPGQTQELFSNYFTLKLVFSLMTFVIASLAARFFVDSSSVMLAVMVVAFGMIFYNLSSVFGSVFQSREQMEKMAYVSMLERILTTGLGIGLLLNGKGLLGLMLAFLVSYTSMFILSLILGIRFVRPTLGFSLPLWKDMLKSSMLFWFYGLFQTIHFRTDTVMLKFLSTYTAVGIYGVAHNILDALYFIPFAIISAVFPPMAKFFLKDKNSLRILYREAMHYLLMLGIPMAFGITLVAPRLIVFIYSDSFIQSGLALQILIWSELFIFLAVATGFMLNSINREKYFAIYTALAALVNIVLNFILIPGYGFVGASIATVISQGMLSIMLLWEGYRHGFGINVVKLASRPLAAALVMSAVILALRQFHLAVILSAAVFSYFAVLYLIKGIGAREISLFMQLFNRGK